MERRYKPLSGFFFFFEIGHRATFTAIPLNRHEFETVYVRVYTFDQVEENLLPPIEDHFSRSFDESFIRHVVTSVNYPPPFPRIESRASPQASKGFNTVPVILHKPVHLTLLLTAKNEAGEKDRLVTWPGVCLSYTRFQQIGLPLLQRQILLWIAVFPREEGIENLGEINGEALFKISLNRELSIKS